MRPRQETAPGAARPATPGANPARRSRERRHWQVVALVTLLAVIAALLPGGISARTLAAYALLSTLAWLAGTRSPAAGVWLHLLGLL
ncbi:MAG TPA: hypothetical protein VNT60_09585, partial [Deinococcales bacterium]|nr:hypothetical protein [Deinococcales bacterium]